MTLGERAGRLSAGLNRITEYIVAALMALLVLDVWLGVVDRYLVHWQLPWPEQLARYLMIWAALLAISCGIARREHIGLTLLLDRLPEKARATSLMAMDVVAFSVFFYVLWFGIGFAESGARRLAMIFDMSMALPFAAVPVSAALACTQVLLAGIRDQGRFTPHSQMEEAA